MPTYMEPQWFLLLFVVMWFGVTALLSRLGGWSSLAEQLRATQPESGDSFRFASGSVGAKVFPVNYGSCLFITVNDSGFHISVLFLFRFQSPPLFIPWSQVESVEEKKLLFMHRVVIRVRNQWPVISVWGRAGQSIRDAYARAS